jgi:hypothetical protein
VAVSARLLRARGSDDQALDFRLFNSWSVDQDATGRVIAITPLLLVEGDKLRWREYARLLGMGPKRYSGFI